MEPLEYGLEALARYEKAARAYDVLARRYHSAVGAEQRRIDGERLFVRTELKRLVRCYAERLRADGVPADEMIADVKAVVSRALVRVGWRHGGALVLEILDWGLEGYYAGVSAEKIVGPESVRCAM
jgi:transposase InsO family protein